MSRRLFRFLLAALSPVLLVAAAPSPIPAPAAPVQSGLTAEEVRPLLAKPLYRFSEAEVGRYLPYLQASMPDLRQRIVRLARQEIGQPYELYLLGEAPYEQHDAKPIYSLGKSDCLVFAEHMYAMALSRDWPGFLRLLQRIRYTDGRLGVATRNHYTEVDWNPSNRWLVQEITRDLAGPRGVPFAERIDRSRFLRSRFHVESHFPVIDHHDLYLPYAEVARIAPQLQDGDFVNVVRGVVKPGAPRDETYGSHAWVGHVGLVAHGPDGALHIIHSSEPQVREETFESFIARETAHNKERDAAGKPRLLGFKFLRLQDDPLANLRQIDGPAAPKVTLPGGAEVKF
jgi:hypothetical protein